MTCVNNAYCICGLNLIVDYKEDQPQSETLLDLCSGRRISTINCDVNTADPGSKINDFHNDTQWYETFHKNRKNLKGRIDCYKQPSGSDDYLYVIISFPNRKFHLFRKST